ncbi:MULTISPECIES: alpha/beta fold hydrolase [Thermomonosporaceae]|uniref:alpha/beta fold hydrolase n=1 Tax=Thermomonosporaceae TaxID=2012 RepID=UPI00255AD096|nr:MULTISPECIES: alpha/beta fold hydrolase [Thermomonosporaceae]MDL4773290.1 alpha/beta fold hydrolase [Actinomadura xylanilytica]
MSRGKIGRFRSAAGRKVFEAAYDDAMRVLPVPEVHDVPTPYGQVRAYRFGDGTGPPVVLLHGRGGTSLSWYPNVAPLAERRTVYALDLLGEPGHSEQTAPIHGGADQAAWLDAALKGLGLGTAHLVGWSFGGWTACNQAIRKPGRVASISLIDPIATFAPFPPGVLLRSIPIALPFTARRALPRFLRYIDGRGEIPAGDPVARVIATALEQYRPALPSPRLFTDDQLRSIGVPVLALIAGRSVMHDPVRAARRAEDLLSDAEVELWPEATHSIAGQFAKEVNARILRFVDR